MAPADAAPARPPSPIHAPDDVTAASVARVAQGVADRTLPKAEWTNAAHLIAATVLLRRVGLEAAEARMPAMIRGYNEATGVANTDQDGYHHTITLFYLRTLAAFLARHGLSGAAVEDAAACRAVLAAPLAERAYPLRHYAKDRLFSVAARRGWVAPDRPLMADERGRRR